MKKRRTSNEEGFTLVETLAVLAVGAVLTAGIGISTGKIITFAKRTAAMQTISQYKAALYSYYIDCGTYPTTEQGLSALWEKPILFPIPTNWNGPYIDSQIKNDPWGSAYIYCRNDSSSFPKECPRRLPFAIVCYGADGIEGGSSDSEDIISWN